MSAVPYLAPETPESSLPTVARALEIRDYASFEAADELLARLKRAAKAIREAMSSEIQAAHERHRALTTARAERLAPLEDAAERLEQRMAEWEAAEHERVRQQEHAAALQATEETRRLRGAAGDGSPPLEALPAAVAPPRVATHATVARSTWSAELVDLERLIQAAARNPEVLAPLLRLDQQAADRLARSVRDGLGRLSNGALLGTERRNYALPSRSDDDGEAIGRGSKG